MHQRHRSLRSCLALAAIAVLSVSACSSGAAGTPAASTAPSAAATTTTSSAPSTPSTSAAQGSGSVTMTNSGGAFNDCIAQQWLDPFTKETGIQVVKGPETDASKIKAMTETGQYDVDVNFVPDPALIQADSAQNLFEKIDYTQVPQAEIIKGLTPPYGVAIDSFAIILGYRTDKYTSATPSTWADFFDLQKFPGKRALSDQVIPNLYYIALMADGASPDNLTPIDTAKALAKLDAIKSEIVWYQTGQQAQDLLGSGEVSMAALYANRVAALRDAGKPVAGSWNGQIISVDFLAIPKGDPNAANAQKLIAYITRSDVNGKFSECQAIGPSNAKSSVNAAVAKDLPSSHLDVPYVVSSGDALVSYVAAHQDELNNAFNDWKTK